MSLVQKIRNPRSKIKNIDDLKRYFKIKLGYDSAKQEVDLFKSKAIDINGNIDPVKKWVLDAVYKPN